MGTLSHADLPPPALPLDQEEQLLLCALRARDEAAFEELLDRWHEPMLRAALAYVRTSADAEEVVQDTWLALLSGIDGFESRSSLRTWVFRILTNRARTRARREARTIPLSSIGPGDPESGDAWGEGWLMSRPRTDRFVWQAGEGWDPHEKIAGDDLRVRIEAAIRDLPRRQREVITLRDLDGWTAEEVCEAMAISEANQRVLLHRARARVRDALLATVHSA